MADGHLGRCGLTKHRLERCRQHARNSGVPLTSAGNAQLTNQLVGGVQIMRQPEFLTRQLPPSPKKRQIAQAAHLLAAGRATIAEKGSIAKACAKTRGRPARESRNDGEDVGDIYMHNQITMAHRGAKCLNSNHILTSKTASPIAVLCPNGYGPAMDAPI